MNLRTTAAVMLVLSCAPLEASAARTGGGFNLSGDTASRSNTTASGTNRNTSVTNTGNGYDRTTTATNGDASRTSSGSASTNGSYSHSSNASTSYGTHSSSTSGNAATGNVSRSSSGGNANGSYNTSGSGNTNSRSYSASGSATNASGTTYHAGASVNNGVVYRGATITNPIYRGSPAYGWNGGVRWYPAPNYYGGGFWGAFALTAGAVAAYGSIVAANNAKIISYQVAPASPGAKLLSSYNLTQTMCGPPHLVVIYGPNSSVICAHPNSLVSGGTYSVDSTTLTIVSQQQAVRQ